MVVGEFWYNSRLGDTSNFQSQLHQFKFNLARNPQSLCNPDCVIAWGGEVGSRGRVLLGDSQLHLHQEDSVVVGKDLVYSLILTPFINSVSCLLCQPPFWGCQSRPKLVPQEAEAAKADGN